MFSFYLRDRNRFPGCSLVLLDTWLPASGSEPPVECLAVRSLLRLKTLEMSDARYGLRGTEAYIISKVWEILTVNSRDDGGYSLWPMLQIGQIGHQNAESVTIPFVTDTCHRHCFKREDKFVRVSTHVGSVEKSYKIPCPRLRDRSIEWDRLMRIVTGEKFLLETRTVSVFLSCKKY